MAHPRSAVEAIEFITNPYVALVDVLIATFFVMVLYIHAVRIQNAAQSDPRTVRIQQARNDLQEAIIRAWRSEVQDEGTSTQGRAGHSARQGEGSEAVWWRTLPERTSLVVKQDSSLIKLILLGKSEARAIFPKRGTTLDPKGRGSYLVRLLAHTLGESPAARELIRERAILSVTVEGHTAAGEFATAEQSWQASVDRAIAVQRLLQEAGEPLDRRYGGRPLFSPERFSVVGRGHYQRLPASEATNVANRRVQVEIRFTSRFEQ